MPVRDDRPHFVEVGPKEIALHRPPARIHPVHIATVGIDLAIVRDQAEWVRETPAWEGVGRKALVHKTKRRHTIGIAQVIVEAAHLLTKQQAFVDNRTARKARHIKVGQTRQIMLFLKLGERVLHLLADHQKLAFKRVLVLAILAFADDRLLDHWHRIDHRFAKAVHCHRHIAPA